MLNSILAVSFSNGSSIAIRDDLFFSESELQNFEWRNEISESEYEFFDKITVSLITGGPGKELWELFGHASFLVEAPNRPAVMFDYGIFSFGKGFYKNFALGKLYYSMMETYAEPRLSNLELSDRDTYKLELNLSAIEKANLIAFLEYNNRSENRTYLYDYYYDNCATRLRDSYSYINGENFRAWAEDNSSGMTLRDYTIKCLSPVFIADWAINFLLGPTVDQEISLWDAMFLPDIFRESVEKYQGNSSIKLYSAEKEKHTSSKAVFYEKTVLLSAVISLMASMTYSKRKIIRRCGDILSSAVYLLFFAMSAILLFFETASIHKVTYFNSSLLVISPVTIILAIMHIIAIWENNAREKIRKSSFILLLFTFALLIVKLIIMHFFYVENWAYYMVILPLYATESGIIGKLRLQNLKQQ